MDQSQGFAGDKTLQLLGRIGQGDQKAFVELFCQINRRVYVFALHRLGDCEDAEEVLHETALTLWRHPDRFLGTSQFMTYVLGIANNLVKRRQRELGRRQEDAVEADVLEDAACVECTPLDSVLDREKLACIGRCMEQLTERQRTIVHLAYFEGLSRRQIGDIVDCSENSVRQDLHTALRRMKDCIARSGLQ
jgi:RNA polymerase sigma-70 factor (ECF subfamily)